MSRSNQFSEYGTNYTVGIDVCGTEDMMQWVRQQMRRLCPEACNYEVGQYRPDLYRWALGAHASRWLWGRARELELPVLERKWAVLQKPSLVRRR